MDCPRSGAAFEGKEEGRCQPGVFLYFFFVLVLCHPCSPYHFKMPAKKIKVSHTLTAHPEDLPGISAFNVREFWGSPRELEKAASRSHTGTKFIGQIEAGGD